MTDGKPDKKTKWRNPFFSSRRETETLFFYPCGDVLLSTNLSLTPSCWHIGHMFFDNLLIISSGRAVFGSLSLRIAVAAIRSEQQIRKWSAYCDPCTTTFFISDDRHPHEWPPRLEFLLQQSCTSKKTSSVRYEIKSAISTFSTGEISP